MNTLWGQVGHHDQSDIKLVKVLMYPQMFFIGYKSYYTASPDKSFV